MTAPSRARLTGGLRTAIIEAGLRLARDGGSEALGLRVITRTVGVTPNAAYRHFANRRELVMEIAGEAQKLLAEAMLARMDAGAGRTDPTVSVENLRKIGNGYIQFALSEPGWFELAILTHGRISEDTDYNDALAPPFELLLRVLDDMVAAGALKSARRPNAEWVCWSSVHGFAQLATRGPLRDQDRQVLDVLGEHVVNAVVHGLTA